MKNIRVLIADDHPNFRKALRYVLSLETEFSVVGEAETNEEALKKTANLIPDVVLADLEDEGIDGIEVTKKIKETIPGTSVIIVTSTDDAILRGMANAAGVNAYILKEDIVEDLLPTIKKVKLFSGADIDC